MVCLPGTGRFKGNQFMVITLMEMKINLRSTGKLMVSMEKQRPEVENASLAV